MHSKNGAYEDIIRSMRIKTAVCACAFALSAFAKKRGNTKTNLKIQLLPLERRAFGLFQIF